MAGNRTELAVMTAHWAVVLVQGQTLTVVPGSHRVAVTGWALQPVQLVSTTEPQPGPAEPILIRLKDNQLSKIILHSYNSSHDIT